MKKNSTTKKNNETVKQAKSNKKELTIGMDLGDKYSHLCVLDTQGSVHQGAGQRIVLSPESL